MACWIVYHRRLLVHGIHVVRKPGRVHCASVHGHVLRHQARDLPLFVLCQLAGALLAMDILPLASADAGDVTVQSTLQALQPAGKWRSLRESNPPLQRERLPS